MSEASLERCLFEDLFSVPLRNGVNRPRRTRGSGIKMVNMGELFAHDRIADPPMDRVELSPREMESHLLEEGDLLFARQSLTLAGAGKCSFVLAAEEPRTWEGHIIRVRLDVTRADPAYYYYFFGSPNGRALIGSIVQQTAAAGIRGSDLRQLVVPCPPLPQQREIAALLTALDDKIELNRLMSARLEDVARTIFRSWFVDFDPVRAKMQGRPDRVEVAEYAEAFPDVLSSSALGPIPEGWAVKAIGDVVDVVGGSTPSTKEPMYWNGPHFFVTPRDLARMDSKVLLRTERTITDAGLDRISSGLLPPGTVLLSSRAPIGYVAWAHVPVAVNQGFIALKCNGDLPDSFVMQWATSNVDVFKQNAGGTTFAEISKRAFRPIPVIVPPRQILEFYDDIARPIYERIAASLRESMTLESLRDALLPKLVSGELKFTDAERAI